MYRAVVSRTVDIHATLPSALQRMSIAAPLPAAPPKSHPPSEVGWPSRMISLCVSAPQPAGQRTARSRSSWSARASYMSPVVRARWPPARTTPPVGAASITDRRVSMPGAISTAASTVPAGLGRATTWRAGYGPTPRRTKREPSGATTTDVALVGVVSPSRSQSLGTARAGPAASPSARRIAIRERVARVERMTKNGRHAISRREGEGRLRRASARAMSAGCAACGRGVRDHRGAASRPGRAGRWVSRPGTFEPKISVETPSWGVGDVGRPT